MPTGSIKNGGGGDFGMPRENFIDFNRVRNERTQKITMHRLYLDM